MKEGCLFVCLFVCGVEIFQTTTPLALLFFVIQKAWMSRDALSYFHNVLTYKEGEAFEY
jgi:hypothetical protein